MRFAIPHHAIFCVDASARGVLMRLQPLLVRSTLASRELRRSYRGDWKCMIYVSEHKIIFAQALSVDRRWRRPMLVALLKT